MDIRTLILARTLTVVLDADAVAAAATRPTRDSDLDRFEDELAQRGFVLTLDLATTMRRLPHGAIAELRGWIIATLDAHLVPAGRPVASPAAIDPAAGTNAETPLAARRLSPWLAARPVQPCPWCATERALRAIAPCGHLVCEPCWAAGSYIGCPICHRRAAQPFLPPARLAEGSARMPGDARLRLLFLGFDVVNVARDRFQRLCAGAAPLTPDERAELEDLIDVVGPRAAQWLPRAIPRPETLALAIARLWLVAPDRAAMAKTTAGYLRDATDVIRVAAVLMGATPSLVEPMRFASLSRGLRRVVLDAIDRLPPDEVVEHACRRRGLWKRIGERLHPFEDAAARPTATLAFAVVRGTQLADASFGAKLRANATTVPTVRATDDDTLDLAAWARPVEDGLRRGDPLLAIARLAQRPSQLLARVDHVLRVVTARAPAVLPDALAAIRSAIRRGDPRNLLALHAHLADRRAPDDTTRAILAALCAELVARAETRRMWARAVLDHALAPAAWTLAAIHAAARANTIYVRDAAGWTTFRRRDGEVPTARLARLLAHGPDDGRVAAFPLTDAPTWFGVTSLAGLAAPPGSTGFVAAEDEPATFARLSLAQLTDELTRP